MARISDYFYKESKSIKKKLRGGGEMARVSDFLSSPLAGKRDIVGHSCYNFSLVYVHASVSLSEFVRINQIW